MSLIKYLRYRPNVLLGPANATTGQAESFLNFESQKDPIDTDRTVTFTGTTITSTGGPVNRSEVRLNSNSSRVVLSPIFAVSSTVINGPNSIQEGTTGQYTITGTLENSTTLDLSAFTTWSITVGTAASINSNGLVTANLITANQSITIQATTTYKGSTVVQTKNVTIQDIPTLDSITIYGGITVNEQQTLQSTVQGNFSNGSTADLTAYTTWSITVGGAYGSINSSGLFTAGTISGGNKAVTIRADTTDPTSGTSAFATKNITVVDSIAEGLTLYTAISNAGILPGCKVILDAGDASSYGGSGNTVNCPGLGFSYTKTAGATFVGSAGSLNAYFSTTDTTTAWLPSVATTSWSNALHKAGGKYAWCILFRINAQGASDNMAIFSTWNNTNTTTTGILTSIGFSSITSATAIVNRAWRTGTATSLNTYNNISIPIGQWMFLAATFGDNVTTFCRSGSNYLTTQIYRKGTTNTTVNANTIQQTYATPSSANAVSSLKLFGGASAMQNATVDIAMTAFWDTTITEAQFNSVYNAVKSRYGLP